MHFAIAGKNHIVNLEDVRHIERREENVPTDSREFTQYIASGTGEKPKMEKRFHILVYYRNIRDPVTIHFGTNEARDDVFKLMERGVVSNASSR